MGHRPHEGARLIPLGQLPERLSELDGHAEIVTHCHHGARSMKALEILEERGSERSAAWRAASTRGPSGWSRGLPVIKDGKDGKDGKVEARSPGQCRRAHVSVSCPDLPVFPVLPVCRRWDSNPHGLAPTAP